MRQEPQIHYQIKMIEQAMKDAGVWTYNNPEWLHSYSGGRIPNVWQWLQYIHLPFRMKGGFQTNEYLAPQIASFINGDSSNQQILKLIIELDSMTNTLKQN